MNFCVALVAVLGQPSRHHTDPNLTGGVTCLYRVRATLGGNVKTGLSNVDLATTVTFTDPALLGLPISATHLQEIRSAVNAVLTAAHVPTAQFGSITPHVTTVSLTHINEIRDALTRAYRGIGKPDPTYSENLTTSTKIKATHFEELRNLVK